MTIVKGVMLAVCTAALAVLATAPAHACSYPPGFDQDREISDNMATVTTIYEGRIEDVSQGSWHGAWNFTLRSTETIWGSNPPAEQRLTFENGACNNWFFMSEQDEDTPQVGTTVVVFATSQGLADSHWLYIVQADSPTLAFLFNRFGETPAGRQFQAAQ
ncbi:hypothetical protein [Brevundimonas sp.]|uniref:hypothetical protein n=1 Tax=Brevundimonas sp. TaxID=1871086 RepID=UPI002731DDDF|nr:hypothetical protein [Brevundimonas sp.]MDP1912947.1 hypothetical protein [Brevundimonas sp.]